MSGIKSGAIIVSQSMSPITPTLSGELSIVSRNSKLYVYDGTTENIVSYGASVGGAIVATSGSMVIGSTVSYVRYTGSGGHTLTLPNTTVYTPGTTTAITVKNLGTNTVNVSANSSNTIEGSATVPIGIGTSLVFFSDSTLSRWDIN